MKSLLASLSLLALASLPVAGQTADDFFHGGARHYLSNKVSDAILFVEDGLKKYPEDVKLKKLEELLKRQSQQQQQQQQQQQEKQQEQEQQEEDKQDSEQKQDQQGQQDPKQKPGEDQNQKQDPQQKRPESNDNSQKPDTRQNQGDGERDENNEDRQEQAIPGQMTPHQARQLLESQKGDEQMLPVTPEKKTAPHTGPLKDW